MERESLEENRSNATGKRKTAIARVESRLVQDRSVSMIGLWKNIFLGQYGPTRSRRRSRLPICCPGLTFLLV